MTQATRSKKVNVRKLTYTAMLSAVSAVLMFISFNAVSYTHLWGHHRLLRGVSRFLQGGHRRYLAEGV